MRRKITSVFNAKKEKNTSHIFFPALFFLSLAVFQKKDLPNDSITIFSVSEVSVHALQKLNFQPENIVSIRIKVTDVSLFSHLWLDKTISSFAASALIGN